MKFRYVVLPSLAFILVFVRCNDTKISELREVNENPIVSCLDSPITAADTSLGIFSMAADMWIESFGYVYETSNADPYFIPAQSLTLCMLSHNNDSMYYSGIKIYFGLDTVVDTVSEVHSHLQLLLVPFRNNADTSFSGGIGPFFKVGPNDTIQAVDSQTVQGYINNWVHHYENVAKEFLVPVYAYSILTSTIWEEVKNVQTIGYDDNLYIFLGCHTISPGDNAYCLEKAKGYKTHPHVYGYGVVNLVLAVKETEIPVSKYQRSSDFLRPCPRFCGTSMFHLFETDG